MKSRQSSRRYFVSSRRIALAGAALATHFILANPFEQYSETPFSYYWLSSREGLANNSCVSVTQDHRGFMWFGTEDGLSRWDGHTMRTYRPDSFDDGNLSDNYIKVLFVDSRNRLWVGTHSGAQYYDESLDRFSNIIPSNGDGPPPSVLSIEEDLMGRIWFGTEELGLIGWQPETGEYLEVRYAPDQSSLLNNSVHALHLTPDGLLWLGTTHGLQCLDPRSLRPIDLEMLYPEIQQIQDTAVRKVAYDSRGQLWIGSNQGLYRLDLQGGALENHPLPVSALSSDRTNVPIVSLMVDDHDFVWVGTYNELYVHKQRSDQARSFSTFNFSSAMSRRFQPSDLHQSRDGRIWMTSGLASGVLSIAYDSDQFALLNTHTVTGDREAMMSVWDTVLDADGNLWIATNSHGLIALEPDRHTIQRYDNLKSLSSKSLFRSVSHSLLDDASGILWVGSVDGLYRFARNGTQLIPANDTLGSKVAATGTHYVWELFQNKAGHIYIGTRRNGFYIYNPETGQFKHMKHDPENPHSPGSNFVYAFHEAEDGCIWMSCIGFGLSCYNDKNETFVHIPAQVSGPANGNNVLLNNAIMSIHDSRDGFLWIGTNGSGLYRFDKRTGIFLSLNKKAGFPARFVYSITQNSRGELVMSCENAIIVYDVARADFRSHRVAGFSGLNDFNGNVLVRIAPDVFGFGGNGGILFFEEKLRDTGPDSGPETLITNIQVMNQSLQPGDFRHDQTVLEEQIHLTKSLELSYQEKLVSFSYAVLDYEEPGSYRFRYRMEPIEEEWNDASSRQYATYSNLRPGSYRFSVQARHANGDWFRDEAVLDLRIRAPFWRKMEFYIAAALGLIGLALITNFTVINSIRSRNQQLTQINQRLQAEIATRKDAEKSLIEARNQALEANRAKSDFLAMTSHELRTPLNPIIGYTELMLMEGSVTGQRKQYLETILRAGSRLLHLIDDILDFSRIEARELRLESVPFTLPPLLEEVTGLMKPAILEKNLNFDTDFEAIRGLENVSFLGDAQKIHQILVNLMSNAIKFTSEGGITFKVQQPNGREECDTIRFAIADTGIGVSEEKKDRIFEAFIQEDTSRTRRYDGLGLGLNISKQFAELMGGRLWFESQKGFGSTFYLDIPLERAEVHSTGTASSKAEL